MNIGKWMKENTSTILTCLGAGGMVATVILAVRATPKAMRSLTDAQANKGRTQLTKLEAARAAAPAYIPTAAVGVGSLVCIFGANVLSRKQQASMASAYAALASAYEGYRQEVCTILGPGTDRMMESAMEQEKKDLEENLPPWDEVQTFYLEGYEKPIFFERTMEEVMRAEYHINRNFILRGYVTFNEFCAFLGLAPTSEGDAVGWNDYVGESLYGYRWIDFEHRHYLTEDGLTVCAIDMPFGPHPLDEETGY